MTATIIAGQNYRTWTHRLPDMRFASLDRMAEVTEERQKNSTEFTINDARTLRVIPTSNEDILIEGPNGGRAALTNHSFGQLAALAGTVPARNLRNMTGEGSAALIARNLNFGLERLDEKPLQLLTFRNNVGLRILRAINTEKYARIWDHDFVEMVRAYVPSGDWQAPREFAQGIRTSANQAERVNNGLFLSDRASAIFLVDMANGIAANGTEFYRGLRFWNSEVGGRSFGVEAFLFTWICGNRQIFGKKDLLKVRRNHVGDIEARYEEDVKNAFGAAQDLDFTPQIERIKRAAELAVAATEAGAVDYLRERGFSKAESERAVRFAELEEGGSANLWQLVQGITASARVLPQVDLRSDLEERATALLDQKVLA